MNNERGNSTSRSDGNALKQLMAEILRQPVQKLTDASVLNDLVNDSFLLVDMIIELQDELDVILVQDDFRRLHTVGDLVSLLKARQMAKSA